MEERGPPPPHDNNDCTTPPTPPPDHHDDIDPASCSSLPNPDDNPQRRPFRPGTYVVQVPKDQIYRVPPPEHAAFVERQRKQLQTGGNRSRCSCLCVMISTVVVIPLLLAVIGGLCVAFLIKKDNPNILVDRVLVKSHTPRHPPEYDITLGCENPNQHTSIFYGQNGDAFLSFGSKEIAKGKYPVFDQGPKSSTAIQIALNGSNVVLPKEIGNSMNSTKTKRHIDLSLQMKLPVKMKVGPMFIKSRVVTVLCNFKVDTLAKNTRVLSQDCQTTN